MIRWRELSRYELAAVAVIATVTLATVGLVVMGATVGPVHASPINVIEAEGSSMEVENQILILQDVTRAGVGDRVVWDAGESSPHHKIVRDEPAGFVTKGVTNKHVDQPRLAYATESNIYGVVLFSVPVWILKAIAAVVFSVLAVRMTPSHLKHRVHSRETAAVAVTVLVVASSSVAGLAVPTNTAQAAEVESLDAAVPSEGSWGAVTGMPEPATDFTASVIGEKVYVPGYYYFDGAGETQTLRIYNTTSDSWSTGTDMPVSLRDHDSASLNGKLYVIGDGANIHVYDPETDSWSQTSNLNTVRERAGIAALDGHLYAFGGNDGGGRVASTEKYYPSNDTWVTISATLSTGKNYVSGEATGEHVYALGGSNGSATNTIEKFDPGTGTWTVVSSYPGGEGKLATAEYGGVLFAAGAQPETANAAKYYPSNDTWVSLPDMPSARSGAAGAAVDGGFYALGGDNGGGAINDVDVYNSSITASSGGGQSLSGVVETTDGAPCANCTVRVVGVDHSQLTLKNAASLEERADDLLEQARNAKPPQWDSDVSLTGSGGLFGDVSSEYPAVHSKADWGLEKWEDRTNLGDPLVQVPANQPVVVSAWDPTKSSLIESEVNSDLPGKTTDSNIQLTHLDPAGDGLKNETIQLSQTYQVGVVATSKHSYAEVELSPGFYEISVENSSVSYTIVAGNPDEIAAEISKDLRNRASKYSKHAEQMRERFNSSKFVAETVVTNENGSFSLSLPSNVKTVSATAYKVPAGMDPENATRADIREYYNTMNISRATVDVEDEEPFVVSHHDLTRADANLTSAADLDDVVPAFYLPAGEVREDVPASNVTLEVYKTDIPKYADPGITANRSQLRDWFLSNLTYGDLPPALQDRWNATRERLNETREKLENVTQANEELRSRFEKLLAEQRNTTVEKVRVQIRESGKSKEELREEVGALRQAIAELESTVSIDEPEVSTQSENVSLAWTLPGALDSANVSVLAHYANGTTRSVPSKYVAVDEGTLPGQGDVVRVSEYPLGDSDPASVQFELMAAGAEGWATSSEVVKNPSFSGELPSIDSISLSTVNPGPKENVTLRVSPSERGSWKQITNVSVLGPDGSTIGTGPVENGSSFAFTTAGAGVHTAQITAETTGGSTVEIPVRIKAVGREVDAPPTLSVKESPVGEYVLTSAEFERAEVSTENARERVQVTAQLPNGDGVPSEVSVHLEELSTPGDSTVSVKFVRGENEESVSQHVPVTVHMAAPSGDLLLWRNGQAVSNDGGSWGQANIQSDQLVVKTFTDETGDLTLEKQNDAGLLAQVSHGFAQFLQSFSLSVSFGPTVPVPAPATTAGQAMLAGSADVATPAPDAVALEEVVA